MLIYRGNNKIPKKIWKDTLFYQYSGKWKLNIRDTLSYLPVKQNFKNMIILSIVRMWINGNSYAVVRLKIVSNTLVNNMTISITDKDEHTWWPSNSSCDYKSEHQKQNIKGKEK